MFPFDPPENIRKGLSLNYNDIKSETEKPFLKIIDNIIEIPTHFATKLNKN